MKTLKVDDKWSIEYDPDDNDRPRRVLRHGDDTGLHPLQWSNFQVALHYALLERDRKLKSAEAVEDLRNSEMVFKPFPIPRKWSPSAEYTPDIKVEDSVTCGTCGSTGPRGPCKWCAEAWQAHQRKQKIEGKCPDFHLIEHLKGLLSTYSERDAFYLRSTWIQQLLDRIEKDEAREKLGLAYETAAEACADYPRIAPDETEWPHYDDQIAHSQAAIRALDPDASAALAARDKRVREDETRACAEVLDLWLCACGSYFDSKANCSCAAPNWREPIDLDEAKRRILARLDQPKAVSVEAATAKIHPTHRMRFTDSSYGDEVCDKCGQIDPLGKGNPALAAQCKMAGGES